MFNEFLMEIGLSEKEALVYVELLKVDSDSVSSIADRTKINRTTVYPVIEQLIEKKLVEEISNDGKSVYKAFSPDRIQTYIETQQIKLRESHSKADDIIPQLKAISRESGQRPIVEYYEGREAILKANYDSQMSSEDSSVVHMIYPRDILEGIFTKEELSKARSVRIGKNIRSKSIYTYSKGDYNPDQTGDRYHIESDKYPIKADIEVNGDKVYMHVFGDNIGSVFVKNKDIADTIKSLFMLAIEGLDQKRKNPTD